MTVSIQKTSPNIVHLGVKILEKPTRILISAISAEAKPCDREHRKGDDEAIYNLMVSMEQTGRLLQPILVEDYVESSGGYRVVFGRRRLAAAKRLGWDEIDAQVCEPLSPSARRGIIATENMQRRDLTPNEEAIAVIDLCSSLAKDTAINMGFDAESWSIKQLFDSPSVRANTIERVADMLAQTNTWVRDRLYLRRLSGPVRALLQSERLPLQHARELAKLSEDETEHQEALANEYCIGGEKARGENLPGSIDDLRDEVMLRTFVLAKAPWRLDVAFAGAPACDVCPQNSKQQSDLFEHGGLVSVEMRAGLGSRFEAQNATTKTVESSGACLSASCYQRKLVATKTEMNKIADKAIKAAIDDGVDKTVVERAVRSAGKPEFAKPAVLKDRVAAKATLKAATTNGGKSEFDVKLEDAQKKHREEQQASNAARHALQQARNDWLQDFNARLDPVVQKTPLLFTAIRMFLKTTAVEACSSHRQVDREKKLQNKALLHLAKLASRPGVTTLAELERSCNRRFQYFSPDDYAGADLAAIFCKAIGIEMPELPKLEDFLPKQASKPNEAAKTDKGKKAKA